jgi:hypothetical protein
MAAAYAAAFFWQLLNVARADLLYIFALRWELMGAVLSFAAWAPALLLVAAALATESAEGPPDFHATAYAVLLPGFFFAAALSLLFLLVQPYAEGRVAFYERASVEFGERLDAARERYARGDYRAAELFARDARAIDRDHPELEKAYGLIQEALLRQADEEAERAARARPEDPPAPNWLVANRFYLEAQAAMDEGRYFDAHYLARRSLAVYGGRREVLRLIDESWKAMRSLEPTAEQRADADYYKRKLEAYEYFARDDALEAFRRFSALAAERPDDKDAADYLALSAQGLERRGFFLEESELAFGSGGGRPLSLSIAGAELRAEAAAESASGVYLRGVTFDGGGRSYRAEHARLNGDVLQLLAVSRRDPALTWRARAVDGGASPSYLELAGAEAAARRYLELSAPPRELTLLTLINGMDDARELGVDGAGLYADLARRLSYPFVCVILILMGAGLGLRFRPRSRPSAISSIFWAPVMAALVQPVFGLAEELSKTPLDLLSRALPGGTFIAAWLAFLGVAVACSLFVAERIARHAPRS